MVGGPAPQWVYQRGEIFDVQGVERVLGDADPVVGDAERLGRAGQKGRQLPVIVGLRLVVIGHCPGVGQVRSAVGQSHTAGLSLDPHPPARLVLVGDDDNVIGDGRLAFERFSHPDEVLG